MSETLSGSSWDVEQLLADALRPIEPPQRFSGRVEDTLSAVTQAAAEELSDWAEELSDSELRALRDPRNWVRPVVGAGDGRRRDRRLGPAGAAPSQQAQGREWAKSPWRRPSLAALAAPSHRLVPLGRQA
jgi:hypothetical protein